MCWFNDPEVRKYLMIYEPMSRVKEERWFEALLDMRDRYFFVIETVRDEAWVSIGTVDLFRVDWKNRTANFGITLGEKSFWGQGLGTDATFTALLFAFQELNLNRVELEVFEYNLQAVRCYEKVGFRREGTRRQAFFQAVCYHDVYLMGILREEFLESGESYFQNPEGNGELECGE